MISSTIWASVKVRPPGAGCGTGTEQTGERRTDPELKGSDLAELEESHPGGSMHCLHTRKMWKDGIVEKGRGHSRMCRRRRAIGYHMTAVGKICIAKFADGRTWNEAGMPEAAYIDNRS
eukprot:scaffold22744_cov67-Attheya_sp.AAC.1